MSSSTYSFSPVVMPVVMLVFTGMEPPHTRLGLHQLTEKLEGEVDEVRRLWLPQRQLLVEHDGRATVEADRDVAWLRDRRLVRHARCPFNAVGAIWAGALWGRVAHGYFTGC